MQYNVKHKCIQCTHSKKMYMRGQSGKLLPVYCRHGGFRGDGLPRAGAYNNCGGGGASARRGQISHLSPRPRTLRVPVAFTILEMVREPRAGHGTLNLFEIDQQISKI